MRRKVLVIVLMYPLFVFTVSADPVWQADGSSAEGWISSNTYLSNNCGTSVGDSAYYGGSDGTRYWETPEIDITRGDEHEIAYDMGIGYYDSSSSSDCEQVDSGEGIDFEYSLDGGSSWNQVTYHGPGDHRSDDGDPLSTDDSGYNITHNFGAVNSDSIKFRWEQRDHSGSTWDHWAVDNIRLFNLDAIGLCSYRGPQDECIINETEQLSPQQYNVTSIFESRKSGVIESFEGQAVINLTNNSMISGFWRGNIKIDTDQPVLSKGAKFNPEGERIIIGREE